MRFVSTLLAITALTSLAIAEVPPRVLAERARDRATRLEEFAELKRLADVRGVKIYLFGGSAATFLHYLRWQLEMERGDGRIHPERFDDTFAGVFRPEQDIDVAVDGSPADIAFIGNAIRQKYPYFAGARDSWELRSLRQTLGDKEAILDNADFSGQNTDRQSVGLLALNPGSDEPSVRDALHWDDRLPPFLRAVARAQGEFLLSPTHENTSRAAKGLNPPILAAIRYYIKSGQFGLKVRPGCRRKLKKIVREWDSTGPENEYVTRWISRNAPKLADFSIDLATTWDELQAVGLRQKLIARGGSLAELFSQEPLRDSTDPKRLPPHGAPGVTAGELKVARVTHGSKDYRGYENLRRSPYGKAIAFVSPYQNQNRSGFFTQVGDDPGNGKNAGWNISYRVDADARENVDFVREGEAWYWLTADKLHVEPTHQAFELNHALEMLILPQFQFERGARQQLARRLDFLAASDAGVREFLEGQIDALLNGFRVAGTLKNFLGLKSLIGTDAWKRQMRRFVFTDHILRIMDYVEVMEHVGQTGYAVEPELVDAGFTLLLPQQMAEVLLALPLEKFSQTPEWIARLVRSGAAPVEKILENVPLRGHPRYADILRALPRNAFNQKWFLKALASREVNARPDWGRVVAMFGAHFHIDPNNADFVIFVNAVIAAIDRGRADWPPLVAMMLRSTHSPLMAKVLLEHILPRPPVMAHEEWSAWVNQALVRGETAGWRFIQNHRAAPAITQWEETLFRNASAAVALDALTRVLPEGTRSESWHRWLAMAVSRAQESHAGLIGRLTHFIDPTVDAHVWQPALQDFARRNAGVWPPFEEPMPSALCGEALAGA